MTMYEGISVVDVSIVMGADGEFVLRKKGIFGIAYCMWADHYWLLQGSLQNQLSRLDPRCRHVNSQGRCVL